MKIEIIRDPVEDILLSGLPLDERHEVLVPGEFVLWIRRIMGLEDLFVYHHRETGNFMLSQWMLQTPPVCTEVDCFDRPPDWMANEIEGEHFWKLRLKTCTESRDDIRKFLIDKRMEERAAKEESRESRNAAAKHYRRHGAEDAAHLLDIGATPHISRREAKLAKVDGMFDDLRPTERIQISVP